MLPLLFRWTRCAEALERFDARIMHARAYTGAWQRRPEIWRILNEGSQIRESHRSSEKDPRVQDAYSVRCTPQVHGAVRDSLAQAREMAAVELNSATDNPLALVKEDGSGDIISGGKSSWPAPGNGRGPGCGCAGHPRRHIRAAHRADDQPSDQHVARISHAGARTRIPASRTPAIYGAAALTSENKALAVPHSVDSLSTSGNQEDYVSMGMSWARLARMLGEFTARLRRAVLRFPRYRPTLAFEVGCACDKSV